MKELKETQEGVDFMCREMEKIYCEGEERGRTLGRAEGRAEGIAAGELKAKREMALSLAQMGLSGERIAEAAKVSAGAGSGVAGGKPESRKIERNCKRKRKNECHSP